MSGYDNQTLATTADLAAVATFAYVGDDGTPRLTPVTPLLLDKDPAFTLTYADSALAREISASPRAALVFSDSRLAYVGWSPLSVTAMAEVLPDPDGELFREELLTQEVRKFPPARQLIDSPLLQRENWWYLPRWIVRVFEPGEPRPVARREGPDHGVLAYERDGSLEADAVRVGDWDAERIPLGPLSSGAPLPDDGPAALLHYDFAVPDMDPRTAFLAAGRLQNGRLFVTRREGSRAFGERPGLLARWRAQKSLERRCKAGLKENSRRG